MTVKNYFYNSLLIPLQPYLFFLRNKTLIPPIIFTLAQINSREKSNRKQKVGIQNIHENNLILV